MANIDAKQVNNIRIEKTIIRNDYSSTEKYTVNGEDFTEEDLYELLTDIISILPYNYVKYKEESSE